MKKTIALLLFIAGISLSAFAENGTVSFLEGEVSLKDPQGISAPAEIGMAVTPGVSIITEKDGYAEVELESGSLVSINSETVFAFTEMEDKEEKGKKRGVFSCFLGSLGFKFKKMAQKEPYIATPATICGVRGTEFSVFAGSDGSALYAVSSGEVAVTAAGKEVALLPDEGVKVRMGEAPGPKFEVKMDHIDYSQLAEEAEAEALADPLGTMDRLIAQLNDYIQQANEWEEFWQEALERDKRLNEEFKALKAAGKDEEARKFVQEQLSPVMNDAMNRHLNLRHYALSGYSMRRYLATSLYIQMKTRYILDQENSEYVLFLEKYAYFLALMDENLIKSEYVYQGDI